jgi:DnaK suppressor protein
MKKMSNKALHEFKTFFLTRKEQILNQLSNMDTNLDVEGDEVDFIQGAILNSINNKLSDRDLLMLKKIDIALEKIDDGSFGVCDECGEPIAKKRLEARPEAATCIICAERLEKLNKQYC